MTPLPFDLHLGSSNGRPWQETGKKEVRLSYLFPWLPPCWQRSAGHYSHLKGLSRELLSLGSRNDSFLSLHLPSGTPQWNCPSPDSFPKVYPHRCNQFYCRTFLRSPRLDEIQTGPWQERAGTFRLGFHLFGRSQNYESGTLHVSEMLMESVY